LGSFRWLINLWFILLTSSTFYFLSELTFCTTILVHHVLPYVVVPQESPVRDGPILMGTHVTSVSRHVLPYVDIPHCDMRGKDPLHSKRSVSEVGRCPCSGLTHGYHFYSER
jgi:hypothetical protein